MSRASSVTHHYSVKGRGGGRVPEEVVQRFNRGNVAILPQDPGALTTVLPPSVSQLRDAVCVVFCGGRFKPTKESLRRFRPVLVCEGVRLSNRNLEDLVLGTGDEGVFRGIEIHHLPDDCDGDDVTFVDWNAEQEDMVMENVAYTQGDHSERSRNAMKARALAYAFDRNRFLVSATGESFVRDADPVFLTSLFPHLDPWGIGGFNHPARTPAQRISFERQLRNLIKQVDSPFARDPSFAFICWNMIQKKEVSDNSSFAIASARRHALTSELSTLSGCLTDMAAKWTEGSCTVSSDEERRVLNVFKDFRVVAKNVRGSPGYKLVCNFEST